MEMARTGRAVPRRHLGRRVDSAHLVQRAHHRRAGRPAGRTGLRRDGGGRDAHDRRQLPGPLGTLGGLLAGATPFGLGLGWLASNFALDIQLQALEGQKRARTLSSPSLMTVDNQPATVASGQKFPIISVTSVGGAQQASVTYTDVTTRLQVTPRVVGDGRILMTIAVKDDVFLKLVQRAGLDRPGREHPATRSLRPRSSTAARS